MIFCTEIRTHNLPDIRHDPFQLDQNTHTHTQRGERDVWRGKESERERIRKKINEERIMKRGREEGRE